MTILHMETDNVRSIASQLAQAADSIRNEMQSAYQNAAGADWMGPSRDQFADQFGQLVQAVNQQIEAAKVLAHRVESEVQEWEEVAASLSGKPSNHSVVPIPIPTPVPTPLITSPGSSGSPEDLIHSLDDLLKPIDWISDSRAASKNFDKVLEEMGRMLNGLTGQRGNIKMMGEFGDFLRGTTKAVGFLSNILDLKDMNRYVSGNLTNSEIAKVAIKALFPIPIVNDRLAQWAVQNMVDPGGHWHGLVAPAY